MQNVADYQSIHDMLREAAERYGTRDAYRWILNDGGETEAVSFKECYDRACRVAAALAAIGVKKRDRVCILGFSSFPWVLCDFGIIFSGACTVGIYHSSLPEDCAYIIRHSGAKAIFVDNLEQLEKIRAVKRRLPSLRRAILLHGTVPGAYRGWAVSLDEFLARAGTKPVRLPKVKPSDLAAIVYTSGTTGVPKGAMLTHDNIIFTSQTVRNTMPIREGDETFLFLPLAHIFARVDIYATFISGITITFCRSIETIIADLAVAKPHWFPSVPRIFDKVYSRVRSAAISKGGIVLALFNWAFRIGYKVSDRLVAKQRVPPLLALRYRLASKLVFARLHKALGGRIRFCVSGAAPLNPDVARFFHAAGIPIIEGYGMTENTSYTNATRLDNLRFGSVGFPAPGVEQRIAPDGEILYRGRNVMKGYYRMPRETAKAIDREGWLHTGDLGMVDGNGFLFITGRKKDLIITSGGKNIAPEPIESRLTTSRYIAQACVIGDRRKYLTALITLDPDNAREFAQREGIPLGKEGVPLDHPKIIALIEKEVAEVNRHLASYETVKRFTIVPEFTLEKGLATPTLKIKRAVIEERYAKVINAMYPDD